MWPIKQRSPTTSNYEKGPSYQYTKTELSDPIQSDRELYPVMTDYAPQRGILPEVITSVGKQLPTTCRMFEGYLFDGLETNPYINNVVHQNVENQLVYK